MTIPLIRNETWRALGPRNAIAVIDDLDLLARLANACFRIDTTRMLEESRYIAAVHELTRVLSARHDTHTLAAINHALAGLNDLLGTHVPVDDPTREDSPARTPSP